MNPSEIVRLQTNYWRKQFDAVTTQAEEARNRLFGFSATRPKTPEPSFEPSVEEPAKKSPTRLQKGDNRAAQAPATARLGQKSGTQISKTPRVTGRTAVSGF
jgi:hypothetical protein